MSKIRLLFFATLLLSTDASLGQSSPSTEKEAVYLNTTLCEALESIEVGEERLVTLSGVHLIGMEHSIFNDPNQPYCRLDVQPDVWLKMSESLKDQIPQGLYKILDEDGRVSMTLKGRLYGPKAPELTEDDPSIPWIASFDRRSPRRYGHLNGFRAQLVVDEILSFTSTSQLAPRRMPWGSPYPEAALKVLEARVPKYPNLARNGGFEGELLFEIEIRHGKVESVRKIYGDRILAKDTMEEIKTWIFEDREEPVWIQTKFSYSLERREAKDGPNPTVEMHLPFWVKVTAPRKGW